MKVEKRIALLSKKFRGRLANDLVDQAVDYLNYNEWGLAFETLCDFLCENNVAISQSEFDEILSVAAQMELRADDGRYRYLKNLIESC